MENFYSFSCIEREIDRFMSIFMDSLICSMAAMSCNNETCETDEEVFRL